MEGQIVKEVGEFTLFADGKVSGPKEYMEERADAQLATIKAGLCPICNSGYSPDAETAILVSLQTDYAAWRGARTLGVMS